MNYVGQPIGNLGLALFKIGEYDSDNLNLTYAEEYWSSCGLISINKITDTQGMYELANQLESLSFGESQFNNYTPVITAGEQYTDENGVAVFTDLEVGLYLVTKDKNATDPITFGSSREGDPEEIALPPFIIEIPTWTVSEFKWDMSVIPALGTYSKSGSTHRTTIESNINLYLNDYQSSGNLVKLNKEAGSFDYSLVLSNDCLGISKVAEFNLNEAEGMDIQHTFDNILEVHRYYVFLQNNLNGSYIPLSQPTTDENGNEFSIYVTPNGKASPDPNGIIVIDENGTLDIDIVFENLPDGF